MNDATRFTSLGRPMDPRYPTNLAIMILTLVFGVVAFVLSLVDGNDIATVLLHAVATGASVFLTWVIAREISPDYEYGSLFAALIAGIVTIFLGMPLPDLLASFLLVTISRVLNRIVGPPAKFPDSVVVIMALILLAITSHHWVVVLAGAMALLLDGLLPQPHRINILFGAIGIGITVAMFALGRVEPIGGAISVEWLLVMILTGVIFVLTIVASRTIKSNCDVEGYDPIPIRIQATMVLILVTATGMAIWYGDAGIISVLPAWFAMFGISIFRLPMTIRVLREGSASQAA